MREGNNINRFLLCGAPNRTPRALENCASVLRERFGSDFTGYPLLVLPSARATRSLLAHINRESGEFPDAEIANLFITPGELPERLLSVTPTCPAEVALQLWSVAIKRLGAKHQELKSASAPRVLAALREELAAAGYDIASLLELRGADLPSGVRERFEKLAEVERCYEELLVVSALSDRWASRRDAFAAKRWRDLAGRRPIWVVGCAELPPFTKELLRTFQGEGRGELSVAIVTDREHDGSFDELGTLIPTSLDDNFQQRVSWEPGEFTLSRLDGIWDVADRVSRVCASSPASNDSAITIGVVNQADRRIVSTALETGEIEFRDGNGVALSESKPLVFVDALLTHASKRSPESLLRLLVVVDQLASKVTAAEVGQRFPDYRMEAQALDRVIAREAIDSCIHRATPGVEVATPLLTRLEEFGSGSLSAEEFVKFVEQFVSPLSLPDTEALEALRELLPSLISLPSTTPLEALNAAVAGVGRKIFEARGDPPRTAILGWLELFLDEAPTLYLINPSADVLPGPPPSNPFLSEGLRRVLGLSSFESRSARDRYRWWYITHSGRNVLALLQRSGLRGEPLLLSPCIVPESDVRRAATLMSRTESAPPETTASRSNIPSAAASSRNPLDLSALALAPVTSVSVSGVADYLACPYRFALRHLLKLGSIPESTLELDGGAFGSLIHSVVDSVVKQELGGRRFAEEGELAEALEAALAAAIESAERRKPGVILQTESLKVRLAAYARWHLAFRAQGWRPVASECSFSVPSAAGVTVTGRIDRIERHATTGEFFIIDLKTYETVTDVEASHRPRSLEGRWSSLQLPLYRLGFRSLPGKEGLEPRLGYLFLDGNGDATLDEARWSAGDYQDAYATLAEATTRIASGDYSLATEPPKFDPFPFVEILRTEVAR